MAICDMISMIGEDGLYPLDLLLRKCGGRCLKEMN